MKAYSLAIAQAAENNEPDEPVTYSTQTSDEEKDRKKTQDLADKLASDDGNDEIVNQLLASASKQHSLVSPSSLGFSLA